MHIRIALQWNTLVIFLFLISGSVLQSGYCQFSDGSSFSLCGPFSSLIYSVFKRVDPNLKYMLFTRSNAHDACDLQPTKQALRNCNFNPNAKTAVVIHGWVPKILKSSPNFTIKDKLLQVDDYNVIVLNWTAYSNTYNYTTSNQNNYDIAVNRSFYVGVKLSSMIHFLQVHGADANNFHFICHSLGAEVTHVAAKILCNLGRITYLDAAAPTVRSLPQFLQPSYTDAYVVESIHTNGALTVEEGYGYFRPIADIDYYPNGGQIQPKCVNGSKFRNEVGEIETVISNDTEISCNHDSSFFYYIASFDKTCKFIGRICDSYENFTAGKCSSSLVCRMGFYSRKLPNLPAHSKCYLETSAEYPFCLN